MSIKSESRTPTFRLGNCGRTISRAIVSKINDLLERGEQSDKIRFSKKLVNLWCNVGIQRDELVAETKEVFGDILPDMGKGCMRVITTITPQTGILRLWFGLPCHFNASHVESNGEHCLLEVEGKTEDLRLIAKSLMGSWNGARWWPAGTEVCLPNGVILFLYADI